MLISNYYYNLFKAILFFRRSVKWSRQQILDYQNSKLIEMVQHAGSRVPYYKKLFDDAGIDIQSFKGIEDMHKIPLLDKEEIRKSPESFLASNYKSYGGGWNKTSGSTGTPLKILLDIHSLAYKWAATARAYQWAGYKWGDRIFYIVGFTENANKDYYYSYRNNAFYFRSIKVDEKKSFEVAKYLLNKSAAIFIGYPKSLLRFATILDEKGYEIPKPISKSVFCYGETLTQSLREELSTKYHSDVFDFYSHTENAVMIAEDANHIKYLIEDYFYPEIVQDEIRHNKEGELVGTSFFNYAMPLIRYKTRDIITLSQNPTYSAFGFLQVEKIIGRLDDYLVALDGKQIYMADGAIGLADGVVSSQYIQERFGHLIINLIVDERWKDEYKHRITDGLNLRLGKGMQYDYRIVEKLEIRSTGKTPFIINRMK